MGKWEGLSNVYKRRDHWPLSHGGHVRRSIYFSYTEPLVDRQGNESKGGKEKFFVHRNSILSPLDKNPITTSGPTRFSLFISVCQWMSFKSTQSLFLPFRVRWWVLSISSQISLLRWAKPLYRPLIFLEIYPPPQAKFPCLGLGLNSSFHIHVAFTQRGYRTIRR